MWLHAVLFKQMLGTKTVKIVKINIKLLLYFLLIQRGCQIGQIN